MKLIINGKEEEILPEGVSIAELLKIKSVEQPDMVSVELNGEFAKRPYFGTTVLKSGDRIEFLYFMGGGGCC
jgi:sulfur carrier protein